MAGLLSSAEVSGILNVFSGSFDTWSRNITVFKEPLKTAISPAASTQNNLFGFEAPQQDPIFTYTTKSGVFPAIIKYMDIERDISHHAPLIAEPMFHIYQGLISIKVKRDCRDYLNDGPNARVIVDTQTYDVESDERLQTYAGSEYYIYILRKTQ